jgi:hypothetical protein
MEILLVLKIVEGIEAWWEHCNILHLHDQIFLVLWMSLHKTAEKRILGYLKHTLGTGLNTRMSSLTLMSAYIDAD